MHDTKGTIVKKTFKKGSEQLQHTYKVIKGFLQKVPFTISFMTKKAFL